MKLSGSDCIEDYISLHDNSKPSLISRKIRDSLLFSNSPLDTTRDRRELENSWILSYFRKFKVKTRTFSFAVTFRPNSSAVGDDNAFDNIEAKTELTLSLSKGALDLAFDPLVADKITIASGIHRVRFLFHLISLEVVRG